MLNWCRCMNTVMLLSRGTKNRTPRKKPNNAILMEWCLNNDGLMPDWCWIDACVMLNECRCMNMASIQGYEKSYPQKKAEECYTAGMMSNNDGLMPYWCWIDACMMLNECRCMNMAFIQGYEKSYPQKKSRIMLYWWNDPWMMVDWCLNDAGLMPEWCWIDIKGYEIRTPRR